MEQWAKKNEIYWIFWKIFEFQSVSEWCHCSLLVIKGQVHHHQLLIRAKKGIFNLLTFRVYAWSDIFVHYIYLSNELILELKMTICLTKQSHQLSVKYFVEYCFTSKMSSFVSDHVSASDVKGFRPRSSPRLLCTTECNSCACDRYL